jgi:hypothetical protein
MTRKIGKIFLALLGDIKLRFFFIPQRHIPLIRLLNIIKFKSYSVRFLTHTCIAILWGACNVVVIVLYFEV